MVVEDPGAGMIRMMAALDVSDEYFWTPERLVPVGNRAGHIPFIFWLVKVLRPRRMVELGTHCGNSYCAMCQSLAAFGIDGRAHAVNTWQGESLGLPGSAALEDLKAHHDPRYGAFSELMQMSFDEARTAFADGSIDLLHFDGSPDCGAAKHDFESWLPKMSDRGIILFHDIAVRDGGFGVWKLWEDLTRRFPSFSFHHSGGLGVLGVGPHVPPALHALFARAQEPDAETIRTLFATRGEALVDHLHRQTAGIAAGQAAVEAEKQAAALTARWKGQKQALTARLQREIALSSRLLAELRVFKASGVADKKATAPTSAAAAGDDDRHQRIDRASLWDRIFWTGGKPASPTRSSSESRSDGSDPQPQTASVPVAHPVVGTREVARIDRFVIHMGLHKTGSTFLQAVFAAHSDELRLQGVHYVPDTDFAAQHRQAWRLVRRDTGGLKDLVDAAAQAGCSTVLLSSEDFEGLLRDPDLAARIEGELLHLGVGRVEWHVVLRTPGQVFGSLLSEMSKHVFIDPCQFLGEALHRGAIHLDAPSQQFGVPYWFFAFDQARFIGLFARAVTGAVHVHDFAAPGPYPGWQVAEAIGAAWLDWQSIPEGWRNVRAAPGIVEAQLLERFVESLAAHPDGRSDLEAEVRRHLAAVLPLLPEMSRMVEARYQASHREALDAFRR